MTTIGCPYCDWTRTYTRNQWRGRRRHLDKKHPGLPRPTAKQPQVAAADAAWRADADKAGYPERTEAEWVNHPDALEELARVVTGTPIAQVAQERVRDRALLLAYRARNPDAA